MKKKIYAITFIAVVIAVIFGIAACNEIEEILLDTPADIYYDGEYLTWDKVDADYYTVSVNGSEPQRVNSTTYAYPSEGAELNVTVTVVKGEASDSVSKIFRPLATIAELNVHNDGSVWWNAVSGANAYQIQVNGQVVKEISDTTYTELPSGTSRLQVKPIVSGDNSYYSKWSAEKRINIYATPFNINYDGTTLSWQGNGREYEVVINGQAAKVQANRFDYNSQNRDFDVEIKATGDYINNYDSKAAKESFMYLDTITDITVEDGSIKWQAVEDAAGYKVRVGANVFTVTDATEFNDLSAGQSLEVSVMPFNDNGNYFSSWSAKKLVYILSTPVTNWNSELELDTVANNNLTWNAVPAAGGYTIKLTMPNGETEEFSRSADSRAYANLYDIVGIYTVCVKANAATGDADRYDSKYSDPITVERLAAPAQAATNFIASDANQLNKGFTVNFIGVNGATGYQLYKDGVALTGLTAGASDTSITDENVAADTVTSQQNYTYMVQSLGGVRTIGGLKYVTLSSIKATSLSFNIIVQQQPQGLTISGFNAMWNAVGGSNGYAITYGGNTYTASAEMYNLDILPTGTFDISVCARGDGAATLASNYTAAIEVRRLDYPKNIRITYGDGNGLLAFDDVANASGGYSAYIGEGMQAIDQQSWDNMYGYISEEGTVLSMTANANTFNDDNTVYFMTSPVSPTQQFIRLAAPTFPEGALSTQTEIRWNIPDNVNPREYTPTYIVKYSNTTVAARNGTSYNISQLEAGNYVFTVRAIGDDVKYLDSEYTYVGKSFVKLATPQLNIEEDGYHWAAVASSSAYYVEIDGNRVYDADHLAGNEYIFKPVFNTVGSHKVRLTAIGNGIDTVSSIPFVHTQQVEQFERPEISISYSNPEGFVIGATIDVNITKSTPNAINYQYEIGGRSSSSTELSFSQAMDSPGTFMVRVKALGGVIDINDIYYIDSLYSAESSITLLAAPSYAGFQMTSDGIIQWRTTTGANGYDYQISYDGNEFSEVTHIIGNSITVNDFRQYNNITIRVRTSANGASNKINSSWTEWKWTNL